jgi:hypothetical protein
MLRERFRSSHGQLPLLLRRVTRKALLAILGLSPVIMNKLHSRTMVARSPISPGLH